MNPILTVLMPVYNSEKYLAEAIESILSQSYTDFEFLIINDGSTDLSETIIKSYNDKRIIYIKNKSNLGLVKTLNKGISLVKTKYLARMDSDDKSHPERFKKQILFMENNPSISILSNHYKFFGNRNETIRQPISSGLLKINLFWGCSVLHGSMLINLSLFKTLKFDLKYKHAEDYGLLCETIKEVRLANLDEVLYFYRSQENSVCNVHRKTQLLSHKKARATLFTALQVPFSAKELDVFHRFSEAIFPLSLKELDVLETFMLKIININMKTKYLDNHLLKTAFSNKFFWSCFYSSTHGIKLYHFFKQSALAPPISLKHKIEFFLRCKFNIKK